MIRTESMPSSRQGNNQGAARAAARLDPDRTRNRCFWFYEDQGKSCCISERERIMSLIVKGIEMPKNCYECLVRNQGYSGDGMKCGKTGSVSSWYDGNRKRMDDCPLVPVPPHGRLIEETSAFEHVAEYAGGYVSLYLIKQGLQVTPTIIPAEE